MTESKPSFFSRLFLAFSTFWSILLNKEFAAAMLRFRHGEISPSAEPVELPPEPPALKEASPDAALQLLGLLQREGRLIDFLEEEMDHYSDAEIGAAARIVHRGCRKVLHEHFSIAPVRTETEGTRITLNRGFDASTIRLTGNVVGEPPFNGRLTHPGWQAQDIKLPKIAADHKVEVLAPAEVEL